MKSILIGKRYRTFFEKSLVNQGFEPIWAPDNPLLDPRLSGHLDLSAIKLGEKMVVSRHIFENEILVKKITNRGIEIFCCKGKQSDSYPKDVGLCACVAGEYIIHNFRHTDEAVKEHSDYRNINVNQGYANCLILALGNCIITSDSGIAAKAEEHGIEVLKIESGHIKLDGFNEGFIGGASFVSGNKVYFTGDINRHPDANDILAFIKAAGYEICCLSDMELFDIGSAVVLD